MIPLICSPVDSVHSEIQWFSAFANQITCLDGGGNGACGDPDDVAYSYDAYGNLANDGIRTYAYDAENRLISVSDELSITNYSYNGDGDRISQIVDGVTTSYVIDIATPLTMVLTETTGTETIYYLHGLDLVAQNDGTTTEYFGYDGLGSVRQMLGGSGSVLFAQVFDPYGNPYGSAGTDSTSWGFTGEQTDEVGLIFLRARYYQPNHGRFLQQDLWEGNQNQPISYNPWSYVYGNPINLNDPSGMCPDEDMDGKCDPGWQCYRISDPIAREKCFESHCSEYTLPWRRDPNYDSKTDSIPNWGDLSNDQF